jgi:hypothetical protein
MNIRLLILFTPVFLSSGVLFAENDPFVGIWKLNPNKSGISGFLEKIEDLGGNKYKFTIRDNVETIIADGEDHPSGDGRTWALKRENSTRWRSVDKINGKTVAVSIWTISDDGQLFTSLTTGVKNDGSTYQSEFKAKRLSGESGLVGTWGSAEQTPHSPSDWSIQPFDDGGLSFVSGTDKEHFDLKFDEKDYPDDGPKVPPGSTVSARRVDPRTIELFRKSNKTITYQARMEVSQDGKTLTTSLKLSGGAITENDVYDKQ